METILMTIFSPFLLLAIIGIGFAVMTEQPPGKFIKPMLRIYLSLLGWVVQLFVLSIKLLWSRTCKNCLSHRESLFEKQNVQQENLNHNIRIKVLDE